MKFQYRDKNKNNKKAKTDVFNCWNDILRYKFNLPRKGLREHQIHCFSIIIIIIIMNVL